MRLTAIEMQGFKSFPDKTRITFDSGVTAIIGPNGSGKSNISDAVRWVLGEMSVKSLRGSRMEDVIFNGTPKRPAANCASVSLTVNTEEEYNIAHSRTIDGQGDEEADPKKPKLSDCPENTVTRKYYRSGESEYYINKKQVRLKDVYELFYDTGIGREGYSVIGQGKISEVLSQKDEERRSIFEEASGISKVRFRKSEAERKLRDTEANLVRVNDILSEIGQRVGPLEKEAENAKQYLVLSEEKKKIEITLWLDRIDFLRKRRVECESDLILAKQELSKAEAELNRCDSETDRMLDESYEFSRSMSLTESEKTDTVHKKGDIESRCAVCRNDIDHAQKTIEDNKALEESAIAETENAKAELSSAETLLNEKKSLLESAENEQKTAEENYEKSRENTQNAMAENDRALSELNSLIESKGALKAEIASLEASKEAMKKTADENEDRINQGRERIKNLESLKAEADEKLKNKEAEKENIKTNISELSTEKQKAYESEKEIKDEVTSKKISLSAIMQKRESLVRMEQLLEGYSDSVKRVISDCSDGKIKKNGRKISLCGTVSNIVSSDSRYVIALETALAAAVQFIVVESEEDAKSCISYLKENRLGRATFLPIESVEGRICDTEKIKNMDGFIGIASELAEYDKKYSGVIADLLGRTVIAENMDAASKIARKANFRIKVVTLDGQVINTGGSYTGGSSAKKVGVFTRAMDIERLGKDIKNSEKEIASLEEKASELYEKQQEIQKHIEELDSEYTEAISKISDINSEISSYEVRTEEEKSHIEAIKVGREAENEINEKLALLYEKSEIYDADETKAQEFKNESKKGYEKAKADEEALLSLFSEKKSYVFTVRNEISVSEERRDSCIRRIKEAQIRTEMLKSGTENSEKVISERQKEIASLDAESAECDRVIKDCESRLSKILASREIKESELTKMRAMQKEAASKKEDAFRSVTETQMKFNSADSEFDGISEKLWDEYELTYSDAEKFRLPKEKMEKAPSRLSSLKSKIRSMGSINVNAVEEYRETKERYDFLKKQTDDLNKTRASLDTTIAKLAAGMKETFLTCFDRINTEFDSVFKELFGGGSAKAVLTDPLMPLECGIDIVLKVPGKSVRNISLLSGGEQSFAAISLYLALQRVNPAPFCIFDEIESALDDVNLAKFASYVRKNSDKTQYILITHRRGTMERADTLYGITMRQKGISDYMKLNLAKLDENIKEYTE